MKVQFIAGLVVTSVFGVGCASTVDPMESAESDLQAIPAVETSTAVGAIEQTAWEDSDDLTQVREHDIDRLLSAAPDCILWAHYADRDGDGFGGENDILYTCGDSVPAGYVSETGDCDDEDASRHPLAREVFDKFDNDCDALTDEASIRSDIRSLVLSHRSSQEHVSVGTLPVAISPARHAAYRNSPIVLSAR